MTDTDKRALLTYVTHKDALDREHHRLCSFLRSALTDSESSTFSRNTGLLEKFASLLQTHHETENEILSVVRPQQWEIHVEIHREILQRATDLLQRANSRSALDRADIEKLLDTLESHILSLDQELTAAIDG